MAPTTAAAASEETRWVDASIRWDDHKEIATENDEDGDDDEGPCDLFKDDPTQTFSFQFRRHPNPDSEANDNVQTKSAVTSDGAASGNLIEAFDKDDTDDYISIFLNGYKYDSDETFNSTGLTLWRAAEHLCHYLIRNPETIENRRVLELGCGLGLCGILAHKLQLLQSTEKQLPIDNDVSAVYLTDGDTDALAQLRANVKHNIPESSSNDRKTICCNQLLWGEENTKTFLSEKVNNQQFDVLLASDVVYAAGIIQPLMESVQTLLKQNGVFLFAYCSRRNVPVQVDLVLSAADEAGFCYETVAENDGILIYAFRWRGNGEKKRNGLAGADEPVRPFEWLTNFDSLRPLLSQENLFPDQSEQARNTKQKRRALHVGCGTSTLGECLAEKLGYSEVMNADVDREALSRMEQRWSERQKGNGTHCDKTDNALGTMSWQYFDFSHADESPFQRGHFDLVVDKSTIDCALCADDGAAGLIVAAYNALRPDGGVYLVVSFHHVDFVLPLLQDCPGADWFVEHIVVKREVDIPEHLAGRITAKADGPEDTEKLKSMENEHDKKSAWSSGSFEPDSVYRKTCNVFICRRGAAKSEATHSNLLDFQEVRAHLHRTNDEWFKTNNPMITHTREADLRAAFTNRLESHQSGQNRCEVNSLPLLECFDILFTEAEREHLTYDFFLEDWKAFYDSYQKEGVSESDMTIDIALLFLEEMQ